MNRLLASTPIDAETWRTRNQDIDKENERTDKYKGILTPGLTPVPHAYPDTQGSTPEITTPASVNQSLAYSSQVNSLGNFQPPGIGALAASTPAYPGKNPPTFAPSVGGENINQDAEFSGYNSFRFGFTEQTERSLRKMKTPGDNNSGVGLGSIRESFPGFLFGHQGEKTNGHGFVDLGGETPGYSFRTGETNPLIGFGAIGEKTPREGFNKTGDVPELGIEDKSTDWGNFFDSAKHRSGNDNVSIGPFDFAGTGGTGENSLSFLINFPDKPPVTNFNLFNDEERLNEEEERRKRNVYFPSGDESRNLNLNEGSLRPETSFKLPCPEPRPNFSPPKPVFMHQTSQGCSNRSSMASNLYGRGLDLSLDETLQTGRTRSGRVDSDPEQESTSALHKDTVEKLNAFSARLRALKSPGVKRAPGFGLRPTPRGTSTPKSAGTRTPRTPKSVSSTPCHNLTLVPEPDFFAAIMEGRGTAKGEVGIAAIQISNPVLFLCQFSDSPTYPRTLSKLLSFNPAEIICPGNTNLYAQGDQRNKLNEEILIHLPNSNLVPVQRKHFNESKGASLLQQLVTTENQGTQLQYQNKFYSLAAACALLKYLEYTENIQFQGKSLRVEYQTADKCTTIDPETAEQIELMSSLGDKKSKLSLFGLLNKCLTRGGVRLLRSNLYQPPIHPQMIGERLEAVEELVENPELYTGLRNSLSRFQDLELILSLCVRQSKPNVSTHILDQKMDRIIGLKQVLEFLVPLSEILAPSTSTLLKGARDLVVKHGKNCQLLLQMLHLVINESATSSKNATSMRFARAMAIRPNTNGLLDLDRAAFCENVDDLERHTKSLEEEYQLPVRLVWSGTRGFYINIPQEKGRTLKIEDLPDIFHRVQKNKNSITCVTEFMLMKDRLIQGNIQEITLISDTILEELLAEVREYIWFLYQLSETVSLIDLLLSLAAVSMNQDFTKPEFGDSIAVKGARHPFLEMMDVEVVPNDILADPDNRIIILTGPNMSGKSTYLRQVILISIMAQVGCFVPAQSAVLRIPDRIFSRVSNRDSIETNSSTFMLEMREISFLLQHRTDRSLIIIDELGRGTGVDEGSAVCWAVCEELLKGGSYTFLATHFQLIPLLANIYPAVVNYHFLLDRDQEQEVHFTHVLVKGRNSVEINENYGIHLASLTSLPPSVVDSARGFLSRISNTAHRVPSLDRFDESCLNLLRSVRGLVRLGIRDEDLVQNLRMLREQFLQESPN